MNRSCRQCQAGFDITDDALAFLNNVSPIFGGKKELIPPPTLCPDCRARRRMAWRNERSLYTRVCDLCGKPKVSAVSPASSIRAYCHDCFHGEGWDPLSYGRDVDLSSSFIAQLRALSETAPMVTLYQAGINENCEFTNFFGPDSRNCYLIFNSGRDEDCYYSRGLVESKDCADITIGSKDELCYECVNCSDCYRLMFAEHCAQCSDSAFLFNCRRCKNCFGCTNLVEKEYHLFNKPCTPEELQNAMRSLRSASAVEAMWERFEGVRIACIHRATSNIQTENCTGDFLTSCKNCAECYESKGAEDCAYVLCARFCRDSRDLFGFGYDSELLYENCSSGLSTSVGFSFRVESSSSCWYCIDCRNSHECFGCIGLKHKRYCILNKQYTKEEYESLVPRIVERMRSDGEWGEFLLPSMSPFGYDETVGMEYLPMTQRQAKERGYHWTNYVPPGPGAGSSMRASELPDGIDDIGDDILETAIGCIATGRPFKITKRELDFYRTMGLPLPHLHPDERHRRRMALRNPCKLWTRPCMKCKKDMQTTYAPDRPETVYCEDCYRKAVY